MDAGVSAIDLTRCLIKELIEKCYIFIYERCVEHSIKAKVFSSSKKTRCCDVLVDSRFSECFKDSNWIYEAVYFIRVCKRKI